MEPSYAMMAATARHIAAAWFGTAFSVAERSLRTLGPEAALAIDCVARPLRADAAHRQTAVEAALWDLHMQQRRLLRDVAGLPTAVMLEFTDRLAAARAAEPQ